MQFRAEAFNIYNHPNFGGIQTTLTSSNFGQATNMLNRQLGGINQLYQIGGPRSLQLALKVWLFVHLPFTYALLIFSIAHLIVVFAFSGGAG